MDKILMTYVILNKKGEYEPKGEEGEQRQSD